MAIRKSRQESEITNLGYVRLWRDDLVSIVRIMQDLKSVRLELLQVDDKYDIDDADSDLRDLKNDGSSRLTSFRVRAKASDLDSQDPTNRPSATGHDGASMEVKLSTKESYIEAIDPDLEMSGARDAILKIAERHRRIPRWFIAIPGWKDSDQIERIVGSVILAPIAIFASISAILLIIFAVLHQGNPPASLFFAALIVAGCIAIGMLIASVRTRTILYTGTRVEAPPWWQKHRSDVGINVMTSVLFFILGLLVSHFTSGSNTSSGSQQASPRSTASKAAQATIGQVVHDGDFAFRVKGISCSKAEAQAVYHSTFTGTLPAGTKECIVTLTITDDKKEAQTFYDSNQYGYDTQGRRFSADDKGNIMTGDKDNTQLNPGISITALVPFNIPSGNTIIELKLHDSEFSKGVTVRL